MQSDQVPSTLRAFLAALLVVVVLVAVVAIGLDALNDSMARGLSSLSHPHG
jgi:hypothetical protein